MNIIQITPGAGGMYCGGCFRDNAMVAALRRQGHSVLMVPLYLPLTLDEADQSNGTPIFFGGISVYLEQILPLFRKAPRWLHQVLSRPSVLKLASGSAGKTRASELGDLTLSMVRGEEGRQARELEELIAWLKTQERPDVICLSNVLLAGMVRRIKRELDVPVVCLLSGEDYFLDGLPSATRDQTWKVLAERCREIDLFISPSHYFSDLMSRRLSLRPDQARVVWAGINLEGFTPETPPAGPPVLGYFARMCPEKGMDLLVQAFIDIRRRGRVPNLKLRLGGGMSPVDEKSIVAVQRRLLEDEGLMADVEFRPNLDREAKIDFFRGLSVFSVPALYGEAFGLYLIEAWASGIPVVQPRHAGFPEIVAHSGGGLVTEPNAVALAAGIEALLLDPAKARAMGAAGRRAVEQDFNIDKMTADTAALYAGLLRREGRP